jgi:hypothetical protein
VSRCGIKSDISPPLTAYRVHRTQYPQYDDKTLLPGCPGVSDAHRRQRTGSSSRHIGSMDKIPNATPQCQPGVVQTKFEGALSSMLCTWKDLSRTTAGVNVVQSAAMLRYEWLFHLAHACRRTNDPHLQGAVSWYRCRKMGNELRGGTKMCFSSHCFWRLIPERM